MRKQSLEQSRVRDEYVLVKYFEDEDFFQSSQDSEQREGDSLYSGLKLSPQKASNSSVADNNPAAYQQPGSNSNAIYLTQSQ